MRPSTLGILTLVSAVACNEPTRPTDPAPTMAPTAWTEAAAGRFRVRNLGTLGGTFSFGLASTSEPR